jgi:hypothetical protein
MMNHLFVINTASPDRRATRAKPTDQSVPAFRVEVANASVPWEGRYQSRRSCWANRVSSEHRASAKPSSRPAPFELRWPVSEALRVQVLGVGGITLAAWYTIYCRGPFESPLAKSICA